MLIAIKRRGKGAILMVSGKALGIPNRFQVDRETIVKPETSNVKEGRTIKEALLHVHL